jgi:hypothetical protein
MVSYLNPKTGEIVTVTDEDRRLVEREDVDEDSLPECCEAHPLGVCRRWSRLEKRETHQRQHI